MVTITSNETDPIHFFGSSITLICTVKLSPVAQEISESDNSKVEVNIEWAVPTPITLLENELSISFEHSNNACNDFIDSDTVTHNIILQCENTTYKSILTVTPFTPGFYNCTATIRVPRHRYYASMELSNNTRFTRG